MYFFWHFAKIYSESDFYFYFYFTKRLQLTYFTVAVFGQRPADY